MDTLPTPPAGPAPATTPPTAPKTLLGALPRIFSTLLIVAAVASVLSTLAFIGYLVVPALAGGQPRAHFLALYATGIIGLAVAEGCQILGVVTLIGQWLSRANVQKKPKELLILLVSLIPYVVVLIFLITLIVYLRTRWQSPASPRAEEAARELRERSMDIFIDTGANTSSSAAGTSSAPAAPVTTAAHSARPTMRDAVSQVVGPATSRSISDTAQGLVGLTMVGLLLSTVTTAGVVVPARGLAPLQASASSPSSQTPTSLTGNWTFTFSKFTANQCTNGTCSTITDGGPPTQVVIQQSGTHLTMTFPVTSDPSQPNELVHALSTWTGTVEGNKVNVSLSFSGPIVEQGVTVDTQVAYSLTGSVRDANYMSGTFTLTQSFSASYAGQQQTSTQHGTGDWTLTRNKPSTGGLSGTWAITNSHCVATGGLSCTSGTLLSGMVIQQQGNTLTANISGVGPATVTLSGQTITITASATYASTPVCHYSLHMTGTVLASNRMSGSYSSACADDSGQVYATITADWTATRSAP